MGTVMATKKRTPSFGDCRRLGAHYLFPRREKWCPEIGFHCFFEFLLCNVTLSKPAGPARNPHVDTRQGGDHTLLRLGKEIATESSIRRGL